MQLVVVAIAIAIATDSALSLCMHCFCPEVELSFVAGWLADIAASVCCWHYIHTNIMIMLFLLFLPTIISTVIATLLLLAVLGGDICALFCCPLREFRFVAIQLFVATSIYLYVFLLLFCFALLQLCFVFMSSSFCLRAPPFEPNIFLSRAPAECSVRRSTCQQSVTLSGGR